MGRTATKLPTASVAIRYDLFDLPTAQHKAGLAGLLLQIESMKERKKGEECVPCVEEVTPSSATVRFTEQSVQGLFDDLYAARFVESEPRDKPRKNPRTKQIIPPSKTVPMEVRDERSGKTRTVTGYVYLDLCPELWVQKRFHPDRGAWLKLWRDMLWAIPRGIPKTRIPFERCAKGGHCGEGLDIWEDLVKVERKRKNNQFHTASVASALWLGAQATNAEAIPFQGRAEQNLLLHFWPLTVLVFAAQRIDIEGKRNFAGYVLAIPEVSDLENFLEDYRQMLDELSPQVRGVWPAEATIDLPAEGALAFMEHLARLAHHEARKARIRNSVTAIEYLHMAKVGNNIKSMAAGRVAPRPELLNGYRAIVGQSGHPSPYQNPLFRRGLMLALLNEQEWYEPFASMLVEWPSPFFVRSDKSPRTLPWFWRDSAHMFQSLAQQHTKAQEVHRKMAALDPTPAGSKPETAPALLINRLIRRYLFRRAEERSGVQLDDFQNETGETQWDKVPKDFHEAKAKVAESAFLEFRSRHDQAFVDHFVATFCSVKQFLTDQDFQAVARALLDPAQRDNIKTLTLLALSANS